MHPFDEKLQQLAIELPAAAAPAANYTPTLISGKLLMISGQLPMRDGKLAFSGRVDDEISIEDGVKAARLCGVNILAQAKQAMSGFAPVKRLLKLGGFVACPASFYQHPLVINGASDLMVEVMGDAGRHTRFAVGAISLPLNAPVEIEALFELE